MTKPRRRDKDSDAGDHRQRTSAQLPPSRDLVTLARPQPSGKVDSAARPLVVPPALLWRSLRPVHVMSALRRHLSLRPLVSFGAPIIPDAASPLPARRCPFE